MPGFTASPQRFAAVAALLAGVATTAPPPIVSGQESKPKAASPVVFSDDSRLGRPFAKDPSVVKFKGRARRRSSAGCAAPSRRR
jgi:hypothetical protein